jgi:hypothetical protein
MRLSLDSQVELDPVDEQPNHDLVHLAGFGNASKWFFSLGV